jgi:hypothetical protein
MAAQIGPREPGRDGICFMGITASTAKNFPSKVNHARGRDKDIALFILSEAHFMLLLKRAFLL